MASNQDILAFLRSEKETREKEKVQEAEIRAKEREQDMSKIAEMIRLGVRDEVKAAVQPVEERLAVQENTCQGLGSQIQTLMTELASLKGEVQTIKDFPALPVSGASASNITMATGGDRVGDKKVAEVANNATESEGDDQVQDLFDDSNCDSLAAQYKHKQSTLHTFNQVSHFYLMQ